ncbi:MAG: 3'-5' exonuclease [Arcobacteraceae bacterium]|jgi:DNA polymerase-3 subunit epsilon|nr:3'-5' exonuclease [Arcobacteraceae bacterium]
MSYINKLNSKLLKAPLNIIQFNAILESHETFYESIELETELLISNGYPIYFSDDFVYLKTKENLIKDQVFCVVDIETSAGNPKAGQIIELAAIKFKNGSIIEEYQSLVYCKEIPQKVQEITGITPKMVEDAPNLKTVLEEFKIFLEDDVFVAHSVEFDYNFISNSLKKYHLGELWNRRICTIDLATRTIESPKYGLKSLKESLNIKIDNHHRAYEDTLSTVEVFKVSLQKLDSTIKTTEDLIAFSKNAPTIEEKIKENNKAIKKGIKNEE